MKQRTDIERMFSKDKVLEKPRLFVLIVTYYMFNSVFLYAIWNIYFSFATPSYNINKYIYTNYLFLHMIFVHLCGYLDKDYHSSKIQNHFSSSHLQFYQYHIPPFSKLFDRYQKLRMKL